MRGSVRYRDRHRLPASPGVYWVYARDRLIYVGESRNLRERHTDNFGYGPHHLSEEFQWAGATDIEYKVINDKPRRLHTEAMEIRRSRPPLNRKLEPLNPWLQFCDNLSQVGVTVAIGLLVYWVLR